MSSLALSASFEYLCYLWVYSHYKYFTLSVRGSTLDVRYRRQILTSKVSPRAESVNVN